MKIDFHDVEATLLAPLCARAKFSREFPSIFNDAKAIELVDQIDYDFSTKVAALGLEGTIAIVARAKQREQNSSMTKYGLMSVNMHKRRSLTLEPDSTLPSTASTMDCFSGMISICQT